MSNAMTNPVGAGCLFIQHGLALCGYSNKYKYFSGLGGKIEPDETPEYAAFRETLEELFDIKPSRHLIEECISKFAKNLTCTRNKYFIKILSFDDFTIMANILTKYNVASLLYEIPPQNFLRLITERNTTLYPHLEIAEIQVIHYKNPSVKVDIEWINDCMAAETLLLKR